MKHWVEVWIDSASGDYVLLLRPVEVGGLEIVDPQEGRKVIKRFKSYEEAVHWLNEDEYDLVEGRWTMT
jgi:hypothetical protein